MGAKWEYGDEQTLKANLYDGVLVDDITAVLKDRTKKAIIQRAQTLGYGTKTEGNLMKFYNNINRRNRRSNKAVKTITGTFKNEQPLQIPTTTSNCITNKVDDIIPKNSNKDTLVAVYDAIQALMQYTEVKSVNVTMKDIELNIVKKAL